MDENEIMTEEFPVDPAPDFDPEEEERRQKEAWEAKIQPYRDLRAQINEHDDLMAEALYELTMLEFGMEG